MLVKHRRLFAASGKVEELREAIRVRRNYFAGC